MESTNPDTQPLSRLEQLGYKQQLARRLSVKEVVGLAVADVSPTMAVLFLTAGVFAIGGTFAIGANILLSVVVVLIALCLAELATMFPIAGGMYSLVRHVLPSPFAWVTTFNYLIQGIVIPASIALGIVGFLKDMAPWLALPDVVVALVLLAIAAAIAMTKVEVGVWVTLIMVVVELAVLGVITAAALANPHQSLTEVTLHPTVLNGAQFGAVAIGVMLATLAPAFNVINGYDAALGFAEEIKGGERAIARAVIISAILACVLIVIPLTAAVIAAPDLKAFFQSPNPVIYSVEQSLGTKARYLVDAGAVIALFNAMLALLMYFSRGVYTTGRDRIWPAKVNARLGKLNRFRSPGTGVLVLTIPAAVLIFTSALNFLIIFAGTVIASVYFCIGLAAFWSRIKQPDEPRPYRMPMWPMPPLVVIIFTTVALVTQETQYLVAEGGLILIALACWVGSKFWARENEALATPTPPGKL